MQETVHIKKSFVLNTKDESDETLSAYFSPENEKIRCNALFINFLEAVLKDRFVILAHNMPCCSSDLVGQQTMPEIMETTSSQYFDVGTEEITHAQRCLVLIKTIIETGQQNMTSRGFGNWFGWFQKGDEFKGLICAYHSFRIVEVKKDVFLFPRIQIDMFVHLNSTFSGTFPVQLITAI